MIVNSQRDEATQLKRREAQHAVEHGGDDEEKIESGSRIENAASEPRVFEDGRLADMYKEVEEYVENGSEGHAPGWDSRIGYYKNR